MGGFGGEGERKSLNAFLYFTGLILLLFISYAYAEDNSPPVISASSQDLILAPGITSLQVNLTTNENATCRYSADKSTPYTSMTGFIVNTSSDNLFNDISKLFKQISRFFASFFQITGSAILSPSLTTYTNGTLHTFNFDDLVSGTEYVYYIMCRDANGNVDQSAYSIRILTRSPGVSGSAVQGSFVDNLVAYWSFDEGTGNIAGDGSGNGHTGTLSNGAYWITGHSGNALRFEGVDDFARVSHSSALEPQQITLAAWINPSSFKSSGDTRRWILSKGAHEWNVGHYALIISGNRLGAYFNYGPFATLNYTLLTSSQPLSANTWTHAALSYDGQTLRLYENGALVASRTIGVARMTNTQDFYIGKRSDGFLFNGSVDEAYVYNKALSQDEIKILAEGNSESVSASEPAPSSSTSPSPSSPTSVDNSVSVPTESPSVSIQAESPSWYVSPDGNDNNPGTFASPFRTLNKAADAAVAGDVIYARGGKYEALDLERHGRSGTANSPITYKAYPGEKPIIDGSTMETFINSVGGVESRIPAGLWIWGKSYLIFDGFEVHSSKGSGVSIINGGDVTKITGSYNKILNCVINGSQGMGLSIGNGGQYNLIKNCRIYNNAYAHWPRNLSGGWAGGLSIGSGSKHNTVEDSFIYWNHGEGLVANLNADNTTFRHNVVSDNWGVNLYIQGARNAIVDGNLVYVTSDAENYQFGGKTYEKNYPDGIVLVVEGNQLLNPQVTGARVINNIIVHSRAGISSYGPYKVGDFSFVYSNWTLANNLVVETTRWMRGIYLPGLDGVRDINIVNNLFVRTELNNGGFISLPNMIGPAYIRNNVYCCSTPSTKGFTWLASEIDYPTWLGLSGDQGSKVLDTGNISSFISDYSVIPPRLWDDSTLGKASTDVSTITIQDLIAPYRPKAGSPAAGAGISISEVSNDFDGKTRPATGVDIGPFEFNDSGSAPADTILPVSSIITPLNGTNIKGTITIDVSASDNVGLRFVQIYKDGTFFASTAQTPYSFTWDTSADSDGKHQIYSRVVDTSGNIGYSSVVYVFINNSVSLSPPSQPITLNVLGKIYYASSNGSAGGNGSITNPWDLASVLNGARGVIKPGDLIWLRGGTYRAPTKGFSSSLAGNISSPIIVRAYPGERVTIDGAFGIGGSDTWFWGIEITTTTPAPSVATWEEYRALVNSGLYPSADLVITGPRTKLINSLYHNTYGGGSYSSGAYDSEVYGSLLYENGFEARDHALYTQNNQGKKDIIDNIIWGHLGYGIHVYGGGVGVAHRVTSSGNFVWGNTQGSVLYGASTPMEGVNISDNVLYSPAYRGGHIYLGYAGVGCTDAVVNNNRIIRGGVQILNCTIVKFLSNEYLGPGELQVRWPVDKRAVDFTIESNAYHRMSYNPFAYDSTGIYRADTMNLGSGLTGFSRWENISSLNLFTLAKRYDNGTLIYTVNPTYASVGNFAPDKSSTYSEIEPTTTEVIVRPNKYESGRANIAIINWAGQSSINVPLQGVLTNGEKYVVKKANDIYGLPILNGTYNGNSIAISSGSLGYLPGTTSEFGVFIVMRANGSAISIPSVNVTTPADNVPPVIGSTFQNTILPSGTKSVQINLTTNENAICKYSTSLSIPYTSMTGFFVEGERKELGKLLDRIFALVLNFLRFTGFAVQDAVVQTTSNSTLHTLTISNLTDSTNYTYYVKCRDNAGNENSVPYSLIFGVASPIIINKAPVVNAGQDQSLSLLSKGTLQGIVSDDDLPTSSLSISWSKISGPGIVTFSNSKSAVTNVSMGLEGTYVLRLSASDGALSASDDITVSVTSALIVSAPSIIPTDGVFKESVDVRISTSTANATIYYTINNKEVNESSLRYTGTITLLNSATVRAKAYKTEYLPSNITTAVFVKNDSTTKGGKLRGNNNLSIGIKGKGKVSGEYSNCTDNCSVSIAAVTTQSFECTNNCTISIINNTEVILTAVPDFDSRFSAWSAACQIIKENTCRFIIDGEKSVGVNFIQQLSCGGDAPEISYGLLRGPSNYDSTLGFINWTYSDSVNTTSSCKWRCISGYKRSGAKCEPDLAYKPILNNSDFEFSENMSEIYIKDKYLNKTIFFLNSSDDELLRKINSSQIIRYNLSDKRAYLIISNLTLVNRTKSVYLDKINASSNGVCIADRENLTSEKEIIDSCIILRCSGIEERGYSCILQNTTYIISGLRHSGIIEEVITEKASESSASVASAGSSGGGGGGSIEPKGSSPKLIYVVF